MFTSLLPSPKILLNVESDDYDILEERDCNCEFQKLGFTGHLHSKRSFGKLTGENMTFVRIDLIKIIEEILPRKFGRKQYNGLTQVRILVSPQIEKINERERIDEFLTELSKKKWICAELRSRANTIQVKHMYPIPTKEERSFPSILG